MSIRRYIRGTTIRLKNIIRDDNGALIDPSGSIKVELYDGNNVLALAATDMIRVSTGIYYYDWQSLVGSDLGFYKQRCTAVDSLKTSIEEDAQAFELYA